ncbi:putative potassium channel subfamily K member 16-like [Triplophysa rosa]|uniref:Potassium channel subfamily K member 16-like n=1 Tax=Triplophysa rosa TaxID=992332 RepID=A0A9W7TT52_TRIRA|nr:putative potassium channel subfamily K member 16-like [Triplophysa rosa]
MAQLTLLRIKWTALVIFTHFGYLLLGATIFQLLEQEAESKNRDQFLLEKLKFLTNYSCLDGPALERFVKVIVEARESRVNPSGNSTNPSNWDFSSSFFFAGTVVTTVEVLTVTLFLVIGSILLLVIPPLMFSYVEGWSYGEEYGSNPNKHYITIYRSLASVWLILGLGWLAALLNLGTRLLKHVIGQTLAPFSAVNKDCHSVEKQEGGTAQQVI